LQDINAAIERHFFVTEFLLMKHKPVISSVIQTIGYSATTHTLEVSFVGQKEIYQYHSVPKDIYEELMSAASHGKYFNSHIKDHYPFSKLKN
jgi:hypothetical protein